MSDDQKPTTWADALETIAFFTFMAFVAWLCLGTPGVKW